MDLSNLHTPTVLMLLLLIMGGVVRADSTYLVKTLWNWSGRVMALSLLLNTSDSFSLRGHSKVGYSTVVFFSAYYISPEGF